MWSTNRTEAVVNVSRAELHMYKGVELRSSRRSNVWRDLCLWWSSFPYGKGNEMIYESGHIYVNIRTLNRV